VLKFGWPDEFIPHGSTADLLKSLRLDPESIARRIRDFLSTK